MTKSEKLFWIPLALLVIGLLIYQVATGNIKSVSSGGPDVYAPY